jgi:hypothetical protein
VIHHISLLSSIDRHTSASITHWNEASFEAQRLERFRDAGKAEEIGYGYIRLFSSLNRRCTSQKADENRSIRPMLIFSALWPEGRE